MLLGARIAEQKQHRRHKQHSPHGHAKPAQSHTARQAAQPPAHIRNEPAHQIVHRQKHHFAHKEDVVGQQVDAGRQSQRPAAALLHPQIHRQQQQRKQRRHIVKVGEDQVQRLEPAEGIQQRAEQGRILLVYLPPQPQKRREGGHHIF